MDFQVETGRRDEAIMDVLRHLAREPELRQRVQEDYAISRGDLGLLEQCRIDGARRKRVVYPGEYPCCT